MGLGLLWGLPSAAVTARTVLDLSTPTRPVDLMDWGDYKLETKAALTIAQVAASDSTGWQATRADQIYPVTAGHALWIRFTLPPAPDAERWYLELPDSSVNKVALFSLDSAGQWSEQAAGDAVPVNAWPIPHRHPLLPLVVSAEEPKKYFVRIENTRALAAPLRFVSESHHSRNDQQTSLVLGIYFGLAGLAAVLTLFSAVSLRDTAYWLFALCVVLLGLTQAAISGVGGLHLWPDHAVWNDLSRLTLPALTAGSLLWFVSALVSMPVRSRPLHYLLLAAGSTGILIGASLAIIEPIYRFQVMAAYIALALMVGVFALFWARRRGDRYGGWFLMSLLPLVLVCTFPLAHWAGWIGASFLTSHGVEVGLATELPIVLLVLMLRSQYRRENARRIQGLDRVDPATGLINESVFLQRLTRMVARSTRLRHQSAVMLVEIVNTELIHRNFGRRAADELPLRVAFRLLSTAREIDSAARLSDNLFGMLVEGPFSPEEAATLGPRIVARCLMPDKGKHIDCTAQVRVAYALVPQQGSNAQGVLTRLEELLSNEPKTNRRTVYRLEDAPPPTTTGRNRIVVPPPKLMF